jgi:hypothetical protein
MVPFWGSDVWRLLHHCRRDEWTGRSTLRVYDPTNAEKGVRQVRKWKGDDDRDLIGADNERTGRVKNKAIFISHIALLYRSAENW